MSNRSIARNPGDYLPSKAQARYRRRRKKCCPHKLLENPELFALVKKMFLDRHWSPEQIAARLKLENYPKQISYKTIYRAIYAGIFDTPEQKRSEGNRGARRKLRHRGKPRRPKGYVSNRGKIPISHELSERPIEANERMLSGQPLHSITPDRGREFQLHGNVTAALGVEFYFPPPHQPWQRGTNHRPRKCLGYRTPAEIYFSTMLHLA